MPAAAAHVTPSPNGYQAHVSETRERPSADHTNSAAQATQPDHERGDHGRECPGRGHDRADPPDAGSSWPAAR
jgi:hypothetical protein